MANKTTTNLKSQEQSVKTAVQLQLARIKKEEEEELWISGEELYTEGSSDEEEYKSQSRSRRKINSNQSSRISANPSDESRCSSTVPTEIKIKLDHSANVPKDSITKNQTVEKITSEFNKTSAIFEKLAVSSSAESSATCITKDTKSSDSFTEEKQEENTEISWKAKRGSFVLPNSSNDTKEESNKC